MVAEHGPGCDAGACETGAREGANDDEQALRRRLPVRGRALRGARSGGLSPHLLVPHVPVPHRRADGRLGRVSLRRRGLDRTGRATGAVALVGALQPGILPRLRQHAQRHGQRTRGGAAPGRLRQARRTAAEARLALVPRVPPPVVARQGRDGLRLGRSRLLLSLEARILLKDSPKAVGRSLVRQGEGVYLAGAAAVAVFLMTS